MNRPNPIRILQVVLMTPITKKLCFTAALLLFSAPLMAAGGDGKGFNWMMEVYRLINFLVFFGGLAYILRKPVGDFFAGRVKDIRESLKLSESSVTDANSQLEEIEAKMKRLEEELEAINEKAKADMEAERIRIKEAASAEAERIIAQAKAECENMRREAAAKLRTKIADLTITEAEKLIRESMTDDERGKLFNDFTAQLGARS